MVLKIHGPCPIEIIYFCASFHRNIRFAFFLNMPIMACIMKIDLHIHTNISSCGRLELDEILHRARLAGLDGIGITDHGTMAIGQTIDNGLHNSGLYVFVGMEYSTPEGDFLLFGPVDRVPDGLDAHSLLEWVDKGNGVAIAAHPFRKARPTGDELIQNGLCAIAEGLNGRNRDSENAKAMALQTQFGISLTGGSDGHLAHEIGKYYTCFSSPVHNLDQLVSELKYGDYHPVVNTSLEGHFFAVPACSPAP